ncbi:MAG TPA: AAA family ATPase [Gemmatimonadales bacterium]|nr:AAA family ATPase [Gemmatimonadales bacterium]
MHALLLTGTCGSGKTTVSTLLGGRAGWTRISEDEIWPRLFGRDRSAFGSDDHRRKRAIVHGAVFTAAATALSGGSRVVIDATVHESPPEAYLEYRAFFESLAVPWAIRILHPRLDVAIARDAARAGWHAGPARVSLLHAKFTRSIFTPDWFLDTSDHSPAETIARLGLPVC